jgi:hypothetical protein
MFDLDLHLHSTASDGTLSPSELVSKCAENGLNVIALTDHDTLDGIDEAIVRASTLGDIEVISGIEVSCSWNGIEVHILGLFASLNNARLSEYCSRARKNRLSRSKKIVERLQHIGIEIKFEKVIELAGDAVIGRPHIAKALVDAGYVKYPKEAFDLYLGSSHSSYYPSSTISPVEAIDLLVESNALPVLAHPLRSKVKSGRNPIINLSKLISELRPRGLQGIEVYYGDYTDSQINRLSLIAKDNDLIECGGSDFHNSGNPGEPQPGTVGPPMKTFHNLQERLK